MLHERQGGQGWRGRPYHFLGPLDLRWERWEQGLAAGREPGKDALAANALKLRVGVLAARPQKCQVWPRALQEEERVKNQDGQTSI